MDIFGISEWWDCFPRAFFNIPSEKKMRTRPKLFGKEQRTLWFKKKRDWMSQNCCKGTRVYEQ
jgi:hypothetical protein